MPTSRRRPPLPCRTRTEPRRRWSDSPSASASWMRRPARHRMTMSPRRRRAVEAVARGAHDGDDFLDRRRVCGITEPLVPWWAAHMESRLRRGGTAATSSSKQELAHASSWVVRQEARPSPDDGTRDGAKDRRSSPGATAPSQSESAVAACGLIRRSSSRMERRSRPGRRGADVARIASVRVDALRWTLHRRERPAVMAAPRMVCAVTVAVNRVRANARSLPSTPFRRAAEGKEESARFFPASSCSLIPRWWGRSRSCALPTASS